MVDVDDAPLPGSGAAAARSSAEATDRISHLSGHLFHVTQPLGVLRLVRARVARFVDSKKYVTRACE